MDDLNTHSTCHVSFQKQKVLKMNDEEGSRDRLFNFSSRSDSMSIGAEETVEIEDGSVPHDDDDDPRSGGQEKRRRIQSSSDEETVNREDDGNEDRNEERKGMGREKWSLFYNIHVY